MGFFSTPLKGVYLIVPSVFGDERGWFYESFSQNELKPIAGDITFIQDNHSMSQKKGTVRGLHCQAPPFAQSKLVRCTKGSVLDVAVDLREHSATYLKWVSAVLSEENKHQLFIPAGFAHGFLTLADNCEVQYKVDNPYSKEHEITIRYDDPLININWGVSDPILSEKDRNALCLKDYGKSFFDTMDKETRTL